MIIDKIEFLNLYKGLNVNLKKAFEFMQETDFSKFDCERYEIQGSDIYCVVQNYLVKSVETTALEAHRIYTDIQYIYSGRELIGYAPLEGLKEKVPYNPQRDIAKYEGKADFTELKAGMFAVYFPHEAHQPCIGMQQGDRVKKILIKVKC